MTTCSMRLLSYACNTVLASKIASLSCDLRCAGRVTTAEGISSPNGIGTRYRGPWVTYTVQVQKTGDYRVTAFLARPDGMRAYAEKPDRIMLEADDERLAEFSFSPRFTTGRQYWGNYQPLPSQTMRLTEGTHVLCVRFDATPFNFGGLEFTPVEDDTEGRKR